MLFVSHWILVFSIFFETNLHNLTYEVTSLWLFRLQEPPDHVRLEDVAGQMNFLMMDKDRIQTRENSRWKMVHAPANRVLKFYLNWFNCVNMC